MLIKYLESTELKECADQSIEGDKVLMVMPFIDAAQAKQSAELMSRRAGTEGCILAIHDLHREGFVSLTNLAFKKTRSTYFGYVAQDAYAGRDWLKLALEMLSSPNHTKTFLGFNDGKWAGVLAGFGLAKRSWAQTNYPNRDFFYPGYQKHFADAELTLLAMQKNLYVYNPESLLVEVDWNKEGSSVDSGDRELFARRKLLKFAGKVHLPALINLFS